MSLGVTRLGDPLPKCAGFTRNYGQGKEAALQLSCQIFSIAYASIVAACLTVRLGYRLASRVSLYIFQGVGSRMREHTP